MKTPIFAALLCVFAAPALAADQELITLYAQNKQLGKLCNQLDQALHYAKNVERTPKQLSSALNQGVVKFDAEAEQKASYSCKKIHEGLEGNLAQLNEKSTQANAQVAKSYVPAPVDPNTASDKPTDYSGAIKSGIAGKNAQWDLIKMIDKMKTSVQPKPKDHSMRERFEQVKMDSWERYFVEEGNSAIYYDKKKEVYRPFMDTYVSTISRYKDVFEATLKQMDTIYNTFQKYRDGKEASNRAIETNLGKLQTANTKAGSLPGTTQAQALKAAEANDAYFKDLLPPIDESKLYKKPVVAPKASDESFGIPSGNLEILDDPRNP